ncbi:DUF6510 family protein [Intrasporangium sp. YIM S08009]|uniref:DUF6510 family protein n=1 Tax=Intrasporangium zincisolvens TaxID=3080018 RepID=UPI002B059F46|nr:DUF6510 family protein [Intrasporangium sp. YIM S08009]
MTGHEEGRGSPALDGNMLAGRLGEVFGVDITSATVLCVGCGREQCVAELVLYETGMGSTARCRGCGAVVLRATVIRDEVVLDLRGTRTLRVPLPVTD